MGVFHASRTKPPGEDKATARPMSELADSQALVRSEELQEDAETLRAELRRFISQRRAIAIALRRMR